MKLRIPEGASEIPLAFMMIPGIPGIRASNTVSPSPFV
jgi:hypothetical protein